jgi:hypothetical protein
MDMARATISLWYHILGYLSFGYFWKIKPFFFSITIDLDFYYDICELAKSHCIIYLPSLNRSLVPFKVINFDP